MLAPKGSLEIHEQAWNSYPHCKTVISVIRLCVSFACVCLVRVYVCLCVHVPACVFLYLYVGVCICCVSGVGLKCMGRCECTLPVVCVKVHEVHLQCMYIYLELCYLKWFATHMEERYMCSFEWHCIMHAYMYKGNLRCLNCTSNGQMLTCMPHKKGCFFT